MSATSFLVIYSSQAPKMSNWSSVCALSLKVLSRWVRQQRKQQSGSADEITSSQQSNFTSDSNRLAVQRDLAKSECAHLFFLSTHSRQNVSQMRCGDVCCKKAVGKLSRSLSVNPFYQSRNYRYNNALLSSVMSGNIINLTRSMRACIFTLP